MATMGKTPNTSTTTAISGENACCRAKAVYHAPALSTNRVSGGARLVVDSRYPAANTTPVTKPARPAQSTERFGVGSGSSRSIIGVALMLGTVAWRAGASTRVVRDV